MSHTNVDSTKKIHRTNATIAHVDSRENKIEDPVGGIYVDNEDTRANCIEIPFNDVARLIGDDGKTVLAEGTLQEVKMAEAQIKGKSTNKNGEISR